MTDSRGGVGGLDPLYVEARRVLLNALFALRAHGSAIIVAGAQAIYLRTGASDMSIAPYTTDGDLAIDPSLLGDDPELEPTMEGAGFTLKTQPGGHIEPGIWIVEVNVEGKPEVMPVDLIVPEGAASSTGRRGARLGPHGKRAARQIPGLEAVLVDHSPMVVTSLDPADRRSIEVEVAGVAALLVAKAHKLHDRLDQGKAHRLDDKDAGGGEARDRAKKMICLDVLRGLDRGHAEAAAAETAGVIQRSLIRGDTAARLRWHQAEGHRVMFVSASFEAYVRLVAAALEVHEVIATRWEVDPASDILTGGLVGPNVRGDAKVDLIADWINGPCRLEYAYGNSSGDTAMLAHAQHPVWVGRRQIPELRQKPPGGDLGQ